MNRFTHFFASLFRQATVIKNSPSGPGTSRLARLNLENLDHRCMPSVSHFTLSSVHDTPYSSAIVSNEALPTKMTKMDVSASPALPTKMTKMDVSLNAPGELRKHDVAESMNEPELELRKH